MTDGPTGEESDEDGSNDRMIRFDVNAGSGVIDDEVVELLSASEDERDGE